jgi:8-oxo-dGTP pyrophosphatase MutT (NUDIX family)
MEDDLAAFLAGRVPVATESVVWGERMHLCVTAYLSDHVPPLPYVTSVRAVVLHEGRVLVQEDRHNRHVIPGGRREEGESPETALRREVAEETGWSLGRVSLLGFIHLHHLDPRPPGYAYPYPDFCWPVYDAEAASFSADVRLDDGYEVGTEFISVEAARDLPLPPCQRAFLEAAVGLGASLGQP